MKTLVVGLFAILWVSVVVVADGLVVAGARQAYRSASWPTTPGTVTESRLQLVRKSQTLHLRYTYAVKGEVYAGTRYDFGPAILPAQKWPQVLAEVPAGASVTVYYDPADPGTAVLSPGLRPDILPTALTLVPFNVAGVILVGLAIATLTRRRGFDPVRDVHPVAAGTAVRLNGFSRTAVFGISLLIVSFAGVFLVVVLVHSVCRVPPSWLLDGAILAAMLGVSLLIAQRWGGPRYLVEGVDALTVPATSTGRGTVDIPRAAIKQVKVGSETRRGTKGRLSVTHVVSLETVQWGKRGSVRFAEYTNPADARALSDWVRIRLGLVPED